MDVVNTTMKLGIIGRYLIMGIFLLSFAGVTFATATDGGGAENIAIALGSLCNLMRQIMAVALVLMIIMAALVYAAGQVMGAETRARASVWATAMFTGALIAAAIYIIVPYVISAIITGTASTDWVDNCCVSDPSTSCQLVSGGTST